MLKIYLYSLLTFVGLFLYNSIYDANFNLLVGEIISPLIVSTVLVILATLEFIKRNN